VKGFGQSVVIFIVGMIMVSTLLMYSLFSIYISSRVQVKGEEILKEIDRAENVRLCMAHAVYYSYINALEQLGYENMNKAIAADPSNIRNIQDKSLEWLQDVVRKLEAALEYKIKIIDLNITILENAPYFHLSCTYYLSKSSSGSKFSYDIFNQVKIREYIDMEENSLLYYEYLYP
jgi:hypothetical protein